MEKLEVRGQAEEKNNIAASPFFHPSFGSAIFDGNVRIYFEQAQESLALSLYFKLRESSSHAYRQFAPCVFVMIYAKQEYFASTLAPLALVRRANFAICPFGSNFVLGTNGPPAESDIDLIAKEIGIIQESLRGKSAETPNQIQVY